MSGKDRRDKENKLIKPQHILPVVMVFVGMLGALGAFIALLMISLRPVDYAWCLPLLALSALLIFRGANRLKKK